MPVFSQFVKVAIKPSQEIVFSQNCIRMIEGF